MKADQAEYFSFFKPSSVQFPQFKTRENRLLGVGRAAAPAWRSLVRTATTKKKTYL